MAQDWDEHFRKIAQRWTNLGYVPKPSDVPDIIYHYTDAAGLVGMLQNNVIWATDYRFLNDQSEVEYTRDMARALITERMDSEEANEILKKLYNDIIKWQNIELPGDIFVFSLSEERDDLSQWRGYAREGFGFTVGLSGREINSAAPPRFRLLKMEYAPKKQRGTLAKILSSIEGNIIKEIKAHPNEMEKILGCAANKFDWCCEQRAVVNKHKSFSSEKEWRIAGWVASHNSKETVLTRSSGQRLVNYIELEVMENGRLPIREIGIGPGFRGPDQVHAVKALCRRAGYDVEVYAADTPYHRTQTS